MPKATETKAKPDPEPTATREPLVIEAAWRGTDGVARITLCLPPGLLRDATGNPLPKAAALAAIRAHLAKARRSA